MRPLFALRCSPRTRLRPSSLLVPSAATAIRATVAKYRIQIQSSLLFSSSSRRLALNMNAQELSQYLADAPPAVVRLEIEKHFEPLSDKQKRYAHFISRYNIIFTPVELNALIPCFDQDRIICLEYVTPCSLLG